MLVNKAVQLAVLVAAMLLDNMTEAASSAAVKFCGRQLSEIMSRVCHAYNSPSWDVPTVEQPSAVRRRRQVGIADECCVIGCTWDQLSEYCSISAYSESPLEDMEAHIIADRSAEQGTSESRDGSHSMAAAPAVVGSTGHGAGRRPLGRLRSPGYGRTRRGRRCWCRRKRRSGRRRSSLMGNMDPAKSVIHRAAPIVGTVSPLLTWGRTLNTDLSASRNNYAYVVYT